MAKNDFENTLTRAFNAYFQDGNPQGVAFRQQQGRYKKRGARGRLKTAYTEQHCDILVLTPILLNLAIECKSVGPKTIKLYWKQHFHGDPDLDSFQLRRLHAFCKSSGCRGMVAVETRRGSGRPRIMHMVPLGRILALIDTGQKGMSVSWVRDNSVFSSVRTMNGYALHDNLWFGL